MIVDLRAIAGETQSGGSGTSTMTPGLACNLLQLARLRDVDCVVLFARACSVRHLCALKNHQVSLMAVAASLLAVGLSTGRLFYQDLLRRRVAGRSSHTEQRVAIYWKRGRRPVSVLKGPISKVFERLSEKAIVSDPTESAIFQNLAIRPAPFTAETSGPYCQLAEQQVFDRFRTRTTALKLDPPISRCG